MGNKTKTRYVSFRGRVWKQLVDQPLQQFVNGQVVALGYTRTGGDNPKYRFLIKAGLNATNSMSVNVSNAESRDFRFKVYFRGSASPSSPDYYKVSTYGHEGVFLNVNMPLGISSHSGSSSMSKACANAIRILNTKITRRRRQVMGLVVVGELRKTIMMVVKPAKSLRQKVDTYIKRVRKLTKRKTRGSDLIKGLADTWLEAQFGWRPLLADLEDGALAVARVCQKDSLNREQFRAFAQDESPVLTSEGAANAVGFDAGSRAVYRINRYVTNRSMCILYGRFSTKIQNSSNVGLYASRLAQLSGFTTWEDVIPQAWELAPWSFLVDYFTNVGDVLEGCANLVNGIDWISEVHITETEDARNFVLDVDVLKADLPGRYLTHEGLNTLMLQSYKSISRQSYSGPIQPELRFSLPDGLQWLNIAALVAGGNSLQAFSKR